MIFPFLVSKYPTVNCCNDMLHDDHDSHRTGKLVSDTCTRIAVAEMLKMSKYEPPRLLWTQVGVRQGVA
jgi:hypothetical protein